MTKVDELLIEGKVKEAIEIMCDLPEYEKEREQYIDLFENEHYRQYEVDGILNEILLAYQQYFRDVFYCNSDEEIAADKLIRKLCQTFSISEKEKDALEDRLQELFEQKGYHALFGKTQGYFGPYIWKDTVPMSYQIELPEGVEQYTVNILKGFVFRSWIDYLTFGKYGTGGWASEDGTIQCIESAYDFESEKFTVSLLKHEAQHAKDLKEYPDITPAELEYRAKLVELYYSSDWELLGKFLKTADADKVNDSHAMASMRIKEEFSDGTYEDLEKIKERAFELFKINTRELRHGSK